MQHSSPTVASLSPSIAIAIGTALTLVAFLLAEFFTFPSSGHRINTSAWPPEAQAILNEMPGTPITSAQWKRIDMALAPHGGISFGQRPYWARTVRASWWWFLVLPAAGVAVAAARGRRLLPLGAALLIFPSVATVLLGVLLSMGGT